jgi:uncharacterized protein YpuA (DUF1002 family)
VRKRTVKRTSKKNRHRVSEPSATPAAEEPISAEPVSAQNKSPLDTLKQNLTGKRKAIFEILDDVKKVRPEQWQDPNHVEQLAKEFANKLGLPVPEQRIKQFVNAYKDATKNGPNANVDELVQKYAGNVDEKTLKEIKKFVPKAK